MKGSCVLFLLNLQNKDVHLILAQILFDNLCGELKLLGSAKRKWN
jgi:hypothetical protein